MEDNIISQLEDDLQEFSADTATLDNLSEQCKN